MGLKRSKARLNVIRETELVERGTVIPPLVFHKSAADEEGIACGGHRQIPGLLQLCG